MEYHISIIDLLNIDKNILASNNSNFAIYTGLSTTDISKEIIFQTIYDSKEIGKRINGQFKIDKIIVLNEEVDFIPKGYNAIVFLSSNIELNVITNHFGMNEKRNFKNVCILTTDYL